MNATHAQIADLAGAIAERAKGLTEGRYPHPEAAEALLADCIDTLYRWSLPAGVAS